MAGLEADLPFRFVKERDNDLEDDLEDALFGPNGPEQK